MKRRFLNIKKMTILDRLMICFICVGIIGLFNLNVANKHFKEPILGYAEKEVIKLSNNIINKTVILNIKNNNYDDKLITTNVDLTGKVTSIDFDTIRINSITSTITSDIHRYLNAVEQGDGDVLKELDIQNQFNNGIIYEVPIGVVSNNTLLNNSGYRIPVKFEMVGDVVTNLNSEVSEYGINNVLIKVFLEIKISFNVIIPLAYKGSVVTTQIPIIMKVIQGEIPDALLGFDSIN